MSPNVFDPITDWFEHIYINRGNGYILHPNFNIMAKKLINNQTKSDINKIVLNVVNKN